MVQLPDGATARIRYFGDTLPEVRVEPSGFAPLAWSDSASGFLEPSLFGLQQALAEMDREADLMLAQTERLTSAAPPAPGLMAADLSRPPPGASAYTVVSWFTPHGVCSRSVEYRVGGDGRPQVVTRTSGACGGAGGSALRPALRKAERVLRAWRPPRDDPAPWPFARSVTAR